MTALPLSIGIIHFTGIGGIGMSGIAEILHELGYQVQGSDLTANANVKRLRAAGIKVTTPQQAKNLNNVSIVVISTAIKDDNVELIEARSKFLPVVHRSEMLGELMRLRWSVAVAGTHGKTTTTSLVSTLFDAAHLDPTVINGGIISSWGSNARLGAGDWMVVEADESDGSFSRLKPTVAIVTNIDPEHLELMYHDKKFLKQIRNAGAIFLGENSPEVFGDYCAGPNHVLPTSGSARFSSPLGVYDFLKRSSVINISKKDANVLSKISSVLADAEGLQAHSLSAKIRGK